jgi:hypothetical protein
MQQTGTAPATLEAVLERITYANQDTGYTVARVATNRSSDLLTVVGPLLGAQPGESLRLQGRWTSHPQYGRQFQVEAYTTVLPATIQGIRRYLGSGLIKGIGPKMAERIVDHFGQDTLQVIEQDPKRLVEVPGLVAPLLGQSTRGPAVEVETPPGDRQWPSHERGRRAGRGRQRWREPGAERCGGVERTPLRLQAKAERGGGEHPQHPRRPRNRGDGGTGDADLLACWLRPLQQRPQDRQGEAGGPEGDPCGAVERLGWLQPAAAVHPTRQRHQRTAILTHRDHPSRRREAAPRPVSPAASTTGITLLG